MTDAPKPSQVGPTKGPWHQKPSPYRMKHSVWNANGRCVAQMVRAEDAPLIAEAGTVYSESGLSPRALLEQRDEAVAANERLSAALKSQTGTHAAELKAREAETIERCAKVVERRAFKYDGALRDAAAAIRALARVTASEPPQDLHKVEREDDWREDPSADERWNAGLDFAMTRFCQVLGVDPQQVTWDAATEELDGDVCAVIGNILRLKFGDDFDPTAPADGYQDIVRDARRYRRLQILGCAPDDTPSLKNGTVLRFSNLDQHIDNDLQHYPHRGEARPLPPPPAAARGE